MKRLLFVLLIFVTFMSLQAQLTKNYVMSNTATVVKQGGTQLYDMPDNSVTTYAGIVGFQYTFTTDTCDVIQIVGHLGSSTADILVTYDSSNVAGTYFLSTTNLGYTSYSLKFLTGADDSLIVTNVRCVYKEK